VSGSAVVSSVECIVAAPVPVQVFWDSAHAKVLLPRVMQLGSIVQAAAAANTTHIIAPVHMTAEDAEEKLSAEAADDRHAP